METQTQETAVPLSVAKGVDAAKLEKELTAMWREATEAKGEGRGAGVTRACVLNLVVYVGGEEERATMDAVLDEIVERHPCRAIVLVADRAATEPRLEAYVSTRCQLSTRGAKQICGEQVTIEAGGPVVATAATAVSPLLVPDVPVFVWWKDIPSYEDKLFNQVTKLADRVVIDSAFFDQPHEDLARLAQLFRERPGQLKLSDINWGRLTSWRSLVASFWDAEDYRPYLARIERVRVEYNQPSGAGGQTAPKALLAVGWLASRLGWEAAGGGASAVGNGNAAFSLRGGGRDIAVELQASGAKEGAEGMLTSLTLSSGDADFYVDLRPDGTKLETGARIGEGERTVGRVLGYEARSEGQRLSGELDLLTRDVVYEHAVEAAASMLATTGK